MDTLSAKSAAPAPFIVLHWPWFSAAAGILGIAFLSLSYLGGVPRFYLPSEIALVSVAAYLPFAIAAIYSSIVHLCPPFDRVLALPLPGAQAWMRRYLKTFLGGPFLFLVLLVWTGIGIGLIIPLGLPSDPIEHMLVLVIVVYVLGLSAVAGSYYLGSLLLLWHAGNAEPNADLVPSCQAEYRTIHGQYLLVFLHAVLLYGLALLSVWISPGGDWLVRSDFRAQLLVWPIAGVTVMSFLAIQIFMHRLMANRKLQRLRSLEALLDPHFVSCLRGEKAAVETMQVLNVWHDKVREESEWPLNLLSILTVVVSLLLPLAQQAAALIPRT